MLEEKREKINMEGEKSVENNGIEESILHCTIKSYLIKSGISCEIGVKDLINDIFDLMVFWKTSTNLHQE